MRAKVTRPGATHHAAGDLCSGIPVAVLSLPSTKSLEIVEQGGGFCLFRYGANGEFAGDTWHLTLLDAQAQATFEFGVLSSEWSEEPDLFSDPE